MPWLDGESCYASRADALAAFAARNTGGIVQVGGAPYIVTLAPYGDDLSVRYVFKPVSTGSLFTRVVVPQLQPCDLLLWPDFLALSWAVAGVWVAVYGIKIIRRGLHV